MLEPPYRRTRTGAADKYLIPVRRQTRDRHKGELKAQPGALSVYGGWHPPVRSPGGSARFRVRCMTCLPALSAPSGGPCVSPRTIPRARVRVTIPWFSACSLSVSSNASLSLSAQERLRPPTATPRRFRRFLCLRFVEDPSGPHPWATFGVRVGGVAG